MRKKGVTSRSRGEERGNRVKLKKRQEAKKK